ncbi:glycosyltransferase family 2 protein [Sulfitobacter sp. JB4-11]|uniref:glycosyltransferase family 2 protein n=1 Tax=Sulfitobacter rhodophyticola TaxID=3238304 RepID=UPI003515B27D
MTVLSVLIPAHEEAAYLPACMAALLASEPVPTGGVQIVVMANGCSDDTVAVAEGYRAQVADKGWTLDVLVIARGGKLNALNEGEAVAKGAALLYLDADVVVSPPLVAQIADVLSGDAPAYASGVPHVTVGADPMTRAYTRFWLTTPFMVHGVPGFGVFAMNRAGRARWGDWPDIISDDTFARLNFTPAERHRVPATYDWPMIDGFARLVRVRRRQDAGVAEVAQLFPDLMRNDDVHDRTVPIWKRALRDPVAFAAFAALRLAVRLPAQRHGDRWVRGR